MNPEIRSLCNDPNITSEGFGALVKLCLAEPDIRVAFNYLKAYRKNLEGLEYHCTDPQKMVTWYEHLPWPCVHMEILYGVTPYNWAGICALKEVVTTITFPKEGASITRNVLDDLVQFKHLKTIGQLRYVPSHYVFPALPSLTGFTHMMPLEGHREGLPILNSLHFLINHLTHLDLELPEYTDPHCLQLIHQGSHLKSLTIRPECTDLSECSIGSIRQLNLDALTVFEGELNSYQHPIGKFKKSPKVLNLPKMDFVFSFIFGRWLEACPDLEHLGLQACEYLTTNDLYTLYEFKKMSCLDLSFFGDMEFDLKALESCRGLETLILNKFSEVKRKTKMFPKNPVFPEDFELPPGVPLKTIHLLGWDLEPLIEELVTSPTLHTLYTTPQNPEVLATLQAHFRVIIQSEHTLQKLETYYSFPSPNN
jgi:hypothetical protein